MTDAQLKKLFEDQEARFVRHLDKRLDDQETRFDQKFERNNAVLLRQLAGYVDTRIGELEQKMDERFERLETMMDAVAERVVTDEQERTAVTSEQKRHRRWIGQLADKTGTKLTPPLAEQQ